MTPSSVRLNKWIADSGHCSRREADRLIADGQVTVNGQVIIEMGYRINPEKDDVWIEGRPLPSIPKFYLLFHKPKGCITTRTDERGRSTIYDWIPENYQTVDPAGRLDRESTGALILSNDGEFLYQLTHPKFHLPKVYRVQTHRKVRPESLQALLDGVMLEPEHKLARVESIRQEAPDILILTLITGYNRQIRRTLEILGYQIASLKRIAIGPVRLGNLKPGSFRHLTQQERLQLTHQNKCTKPGPRQ